VFQYIFLEKKGCTTRFETAPQEEFPIVFEYLFIYPGPNPYLATILHPKDAAKDAAKNAVSFLQDAFPRRIAALSSHTVWRKQKMQPNG